MQLSQAVFLDFLSVHPGDLDTTCLSEVVEHWRFCDDTKAEDVSTVIADAQIVVVNKVVLNESNLSSAKNLKLICAAATGVNNIDLAAAQKQGIAVCNVQRYATGSVVQHVFALILSLTTRLEQYQNDVFSGRWSRSSFFCLLDYPIRELQGLTLGIVGFGELGQAVANVAKAFGMKVLLAKRDENDDRQHRVALHDLLPAVDVLSLHCPLTENTKGLIAEAELALMKPDAIIINTARGGLIDEQALLCALQQGRIGGAGLDVLAQEPPPEDHFLLQQKLPNLIITPHTAWASRESRQRLLDEVARNIQAYQQGQRRNSV
jgi:glycerate dehydrogenase